MEDTGWFAVDTRNRPRYVDGFSLLHLSYGVIAGAALLELGADVGATFGIVVGLAVLWELLENGCSHLINPLFGLPGDAKDTLQNMAGDVVVAVAGTGLAVAVPWPADLGIGLGIFAAGVVWSVARARRKPTLAGSSLL
jgi:hypothetical protein